MFFPYLYTDMSLKHLFILSLLLPCVLNLHAQAHNDTICFEDGSVYIGQITDSLFNGRGKMIYADKTIYEGEWKDGLWNGKGELLYPDGDSYSGEFKEHKFNGYGTYKYADGGNYEGYWENGLFNGSGTMNYSDGSTYTGKWENDLKEGPGVYYDASDNTLYKGYFHNDYYLTSSYDVYYDIYRGLITEDDLLPEEEETVSGKGIVTYSGFSCGWGQLLSLQFDFGPAQGPFIGFCLGLDIASHGKGKDAFGYEYDEEADQNVLVIYVKWDEYMDEVITEKTYPKIEILGELGWRWRNITLGGSAGITVDKTYRNCRGGQGSPFGSNELYFREKATGCGFAYRVFSDIVVKRYYAPDRSDLLNVSFRVGYGNCEGLFMGLGICF